MLAIFLILGIVLLVVFIRISLKINHITQTISDATDEAKEFLSNMRRLASPVVISKIVVKYIRKYFEKRRKA